jgi:hypothetical protein
MTWYAIDMHVHVHVHVQDCHITQNYVTLL